MTGIHLEIKGRPITKKNHQEIIYNPKTKKRQLVSSSAYKRYEKEALLQLPSVPYPIDFPVNVRCLYYMPTRHTVDLVNLEQATDDILQAAGIIKNDESKVIASHDGSRVYYDKDNPRVEIDITPFREDSYFVVNGPRFRRIHRGRVVHYI